MAKSAQDDAHTYTIMKKGGGRCVFGLKDPEPVASEEDESRRRTGNETALYPKELNLHFSLAFSTTILTPSMSVCRSPTFSTPLCHCAYTHTVAVVVYTHTYTLTLLAYTA